MKTLVAQQMSVQFANERVLDRLDFVIEPGEFVSVVGPSGCGKSTLLRVLAGLRQASSGSILGLPQRVSFVFQHPTLCPWRTVLDNVALPLELQGVPRREREFAAVEAIRLVELEPIAYRKLPKQLSGGMQMRVSLARALVTQPELLLLDEPLSALDELLREQLADMLWRLWNQHRWTTVLVTHSMSEAVYLSQRILMLAGRPAQIADEFSNSPRSTPLERSRGEYRASLEFVSAVSQASQRMRAIMERSQGTGWNGMTTGERAG